MIGLMQGTSEQHQQFKSETRKALSVDQVAKGIGVFAVLIYSCGFFTVNAYLLEFNVHEFAILKPQFIITGVLVCAVYLICILFPLLGVAYLGADKRKDFSRTNQQHEYQIWARTKFRSLLLLPVVALVFLQERTEWPRHLSHFVSSVLVAIAVTLTAFISASFTYKSYRYIRSASQFKRKASHQRIHRIYDALVWATLGTALFMGLFTHYIYRTIPAQFGGAEPRVARLLIKSEERAQIVAVGISVASTGISDRLTLLFEGDTDLILRLSDGTVLSLSKSVINAVQFP